MRRAAGRIILVSNEPECGAAGELSRSYVDECWLRTEATAERCDVG